jgi:hypothetical protein
MELTRENIEKIWLTDEAVFIKTKDGKIGKEYFSDYSRLKYATTKQRENYKLSYFGIHWEEIDEDLSFNGFFNKKTKQTEISKIFSQLHELNVSAFARKLSISQPLMASYLKGTKIPSEKRKKEIEKGLHLLGEELLKIELN